MHRRRWGSHATSAQTARTCSNPHRRRQPALLLCRLRIRPCPGCLGSLLPNALAARTCSSPVRHHHLLCLHSHHQRPLRSPRSHHVRCELLALRSPARPSTQNSRSPYCPWRGRPGTSQTAGLGWAPPSAPLLPRMAPCRKGRAARAQAWAHPTNGRIHSPDRHPAAHVGTLQTAGPDSSLCWLCAQCKAPRRKGMVDHPPPAPAGPEPCSGRQARRPKQNSRIHPLRWLPSQGTWQTGDLGWGHPS